MGNSQEELQKRWVDLKNKVEKISKAKEQAIWERDRVLGKLKGLGFETAEEAMAEATKLESEAAKATEELQKSLEGIESEFRELLELVGVK